MIEIIVKDFLESKLPVPIFMEYPANSPASFVVLKKSDSGRENLVDVAMFVADSYASSLLETAKLNELVKIAMDNLIELDAVSSSKRAGDYPFPDTKNKRYRYQTVHNITHY